MNAADKNSPPPVLVTGLAGNLGCKLAPHLKDRLLVGVDLYPPRLDHPRVEFCALDLSQPEAVETLVNLMRESGVRQVIHLAFVLDPLRTGAVAARRQWEINVHGTRQLLEAIARVNRQHKQVEFFLYLSSVTSYGPQLPYPVPENHPQQPHTYTYALHKKETDQLCCAWHPKLGGCAVYIVRGHIFLGPAVENFITRALQGRPADRTRLGHWVLRRGWRLPLVLPRGQKFRGLYQFMHIEDAARLMAWLSRHHQPGKLEILNAQGRGEPLTAEQLARLCGLALVRIPSYTLTRLLYHIGWALGLSPIPPEALPYFAGSYVMSTRRLERLLGPEFPEIVRFTAEEAVRETVRRVAG